MKRWLVCGWIVLVMMLGLSHCTGPIPPSSNEEVSTESTTNMEPTQKESLLPEEPTVPKLELVQEVTKELTPEPEDEVAPEPTTEVSDEPEVKDASPDESVVEAIPEKPAPKLLQESDLVYLGAFLVPQGGKDRATFSYGGYAMAYNPTNNSLFLGGHHIGFHVGEVSIPKLSKSTNIKDLERGKLLQPHEDIQKKLKSFDLPQGGGGIRLGDLLVHGNRLIATYYTYYDAEGKAKKAFAYYDSLTLKTAKGYGLFAPNVTAGHVAGYLATVPQGWQSVFGKALCGLSGIPIASRQSNGPAIFGFDPSQLGIVDPVPVKAFADYPLKTPLRDRTKANPVYNALSRMNGIVLPKNSRSVLVWGGHGAWDPKTSSVCYGTPQACNTTSGGKGYHAKNGQYRYQIWAYDIDKLTQTNIPPHKQEPYGIWAPKPLFAGGERYFTSVAYDEVRNIIYVSHAKAEKYGCCGYNPVIYAYTTR